MIWQWIERVTHLTFLLLSAVLIVKLYSNNTANVDIKAFSLEVASLKKEVKDNVSSSSVYIEGRLNKIAVIQDEYQTSTSNRVYVIENRLSALEAENKQIKQQQKTVINNSNVVNNNIN